MKYITLLFALAFIIGCGSPRSDRPISKTKKPVSWPELEEFASQTYTQSMAMPAESKQWKSVAKYAKTDEFKASFEKLKSSPLPDEYSTREREAAFESLIDKYKELIAESNAGAPSKKIASIYSEIESKLSLVRKNDS